MDTKINVYILSIIPKLHNFLIILTVISAPSILSARRNLHLKSAIYRHDLKSATPFWLGCTTGDIIGTARQHHE